MYRSLIPILTYIIVVAAAPQTTVNSDTPYVKIQPIPEDAPEPKIPYRESRIENLPLTIPGNIIAKNKGENTKEQTDKNDNVPSVTIPDTHQEKNNAIKRETIPEHDDKNKPNSELDRIISDEYALEENESSRKIRSEATTASYESDTVEPTEVTESVEQLVQQTEVYETKTKAPSPRFLSKLSYFGKQENVHSLIATNLVERNGFRKFKSKCRCEKIWNCPKLQITVPRCPNEYFLCCF